MTGPGAGAPRPEALKGARPQAATHPQHAAHRHIALLAALGAALLVAAALAIALLPGGGSAPAPAALGIVPLRVSSGNGIATGFAVADGRVITVSHVLDGPVTVGGRRVRVVRVDRRSDLALLSVPDLDADRPGIASAVNGEHLGVVRLLDGRPSVLSVHVRRSIVAHVRVAGANHAVVRPALELSARVAPGDSGAAVVSDDGALAGVIFAASSNRSDTAYAVDASAVRHLLHRP